MDEDLITLIDSALGSDQGLYHLVHIVNVQAGAENVCNRFRQNVRAFARFIPTENVFTHGFRAYLKSPLFQSFAEFGLDRD